MRVTASSLGTVGFKFAAYRIDWLGQVAVALEAPEPALCFGHPGDGPPQSHVPRRASV
jgi:hypothetical protein